MKYIEMIKFLNKHGIMVMQPVIASEVSSQLSKKISEDEYELICAKIYEEYLDSIEEPDIWYLVDEELTKRGYKEEL